MDLLDPTIITIATIPAIVALVNLAKSFGLDGRLSAVLAIGLGVAFTFGQHYLDAELWSQISNGLILGLGAAGLFDMTKSAPGSILRLGGDASASEGSETNTVTIPASWQMNGSNQT